MIARYFWSVYVLCGLPATNRDNTCQRQQMIFMIWWSRYKFKTIKAKGNVFKRRLANYSQTN